MSGSASFDVGGNGSSLFISPSQGGAECPPCGQSYPCAIHYAMHRHRMGEGAHHFFSSMRAQSVTFLKKEVFSAFFRKALFFFHV